MLDRDHYDIEKVKDRILEFLAVRKLKPDARSSILCFVGPPGVGKTSLGRSIAAAMERKFERISVGGVRDESEIRGHRRTYIGALPGTIVRALRDAESNNPVLMIDEIDKMGADFRGDPASAMLEVLDPEQNSTFRDHYLDVPFDLSSVFFICTANQMDPIPPALRDRMEVIELSGYTHEEKREIAKRYLVPRQMERNGVGRSKIEFTDPALDVLIDGYTREAGVRGLEREIGSVARKVAREFAEGSRRSKRTIRPKTVGELLGRPRFTSDVSRRTGEPGVATGLAWTPVGGDVLFIEATSFPGDGKLQITGQLGDVMKESAAAALSWIKGHAGQLDPPVDVGWFRGHDLHLHVPAGAIPKDGPSAGITMATAIASLITGRPVRSDTAMTGEITLTGQVLPIGGLKEKALAAQRAEIGRVIIPQRNEAGRRRRAAEPAREDGVPARRPRRPGARGGARATRRRPPRQGPLDVCPAPSQPRADRRSSASLLRGSVFAGSGRVQCPHRKRISRREMAAKKKAAKAGAGAVAAGHAVQSNPYIQRLIEDQELRDNLRSAFDSAKKAYGRASSGKGPATKALMDDKKVQRDLKEAAESLRDASEALRGPKQKKRKGRFGQAAADLPGGRCGSAGAERGPAQEGARRALRRRGGVRVHGQHDAGAQLQLERTGGHRLKRGRPELLTRGAYGRPSSFLDPQAGWVGCRAS